MRIIKICCGLLSFIFFPLCAKANNELHKPTGTAGMERVILGQSKSFGNKNTLKQDMFNVLVNGISTQRTNTIFVIQNDFILGEDIIIPSGCGLEFDGGSLRDGRINTNGCFINAGLYQVFDNVEFNSINTYNGSLQVIDNIYIKILKPYSFVNKKTNTIIQANTVVNRRYTYKITGKSSSPLKDNKDVIITINGKKYTVAEVVSDKKYKLKYDYTCIIGISNKSGEMVSGDVDSLNGITFYSISPLSYSHCSIVKNKEIHPEWFGAKGDNCNDDSYAFNSALDLAYNSDSKVIIGNGVYKIDDALVVHTHTNLAGVTPTVEFPVKGCFSVNTEVAMLVFDKYNPSGSYILSNIGFKPYSDKYKYKYVGIKVYHSQNFANISSVGFAYPQIGIDIDAIGGVQMLRCEDVSVWSNNNSGSVAVSANHRLGGWFNVNYFRFACVSNCAGLKIEGGNNNTLDGGAGYVESGTEYLINLDKGASLIVRGGLYNESGRFAKLRNSSKLKIEGDNYLIGPIDCDETSYVSYSSPSIISRNKIINNSVVYNDVVLAHYIVFPPKTNLWYEAINNRIVKPQEVGKNYTATMYNGRLYTKGFCKIPVGDIDIKGKTIALRVISPSAYTANKREYPIVLNSGINGTSSAFSLATWLGNTSVLYAPGEKIVSSIERGERFIFLPSERKSLILNNVTTTGNASFMVSDIYIIDKDSKDIVGNEELRIIDILSSLDAYKQNDGFLLGYNKGTSKERPTDLAKEDEGFEYFDTSLHKPIYWAGDVSIGDKGWVDINGKHPNPQYNK